MVQPGRRTWWLVLLVGLTGAMGWLPSVRAQAPAPRPGEVAARDSVQIQGNGPRRGDEGRTYANIQGTGTNPRFASYAILDFPLPRSATGKEAVVTIHLTQSVTRFTRDGKLRLFLLDDSKTNLETLAQNLRFEPARVPDGLGNNLPKLIPAGTFDFLKGGMGDTDPIPLSLDDAGRKLVADLAAAGGSLRVVIVPDVPHVAATYFGAGARDQENRPRLTFGPATPTSRP